MAVRPSLYNDLVQFRGILLFCLLLAIGHLSCTPSSLSGLFHPSSIVISVPYELSTLDPHAKDTISNYAILSNIYEPLVRTDADMKLHPALAATWDNPDLNTWVVHLRPD